MRKYIIIFSLYIFYLFVVGNFPSDFALLGARSCTRLVVKNCIDSTVTRYFVRTAYIYIFCLRILDWRAGQVICEFGLCTCTSTRF